MVNKKSSDKTSKKSRVELGKLKLKKETIKDLSTAKQRQVKGGKACAGNTSGATANCSETCRCL